MVRVSPTPPSSAHSSPYPKIPLSSVTGDGWLGSGSSLLPSTFTRASLGVDLSRDPWISFSFGVCFPPLQTALTPLSRFSIELRDPLKDFPHSPSHAILCFAPAETSLSQEQVGLSKSIKIHFPPTAVICLELFVSFIPSSDGESRRYP